LECRARRFDRITGLTGWVGARGWDVRHFFIPYILYILSKKALECRARRFDGITGLTGWVGARLGCWRLFHPVHPVHPVKESLGMQGKRL
jgi:hypothetical protein